MVAKDGGREKKKRKKKEKKKVIVPVGFVNRVGTLVLVLVLVPA